MNYYENMNVFIVYGGKDDSSTKFEVRNDIAILELEGLSWIKIRNIGILYLWYIKYYTKTNGKMESQFSYAGYLVVNIRRLGIIELQ